MLLPLLTKVAKKEILSFMHQAKHRLIFVKPAYYKWEIEEIINIADGGNVYCELYLDENEDSIRFGFGEKEAIDLLTNSTNLINVQMVKNIRVAILIVDNISVFFTPTIVHLDDVEEMVSFPNGIVGGPDLTRSILELFPTYNLELPEEVDISIPFESKTIEFHNKEIIINKLSEMVQSLKDNPPVDPKRLKKINFYRNNYKLLKRQVNGVKIKNKSMNLKPFINVLKTKSERLKNSWNIFTKQDIEQLENISLFDYELRKVDQDYLIDAGRFGKLIKSDQKSKYEEEVEKVTKEFVSFLMGDGDEKNRFVITNAGEQEGKKQLTNVLSNSRVDLLNHLYSESKSDPNFFNYILYMDRFLNREYDNGKGKSQEHITRTFIQQFIDNKIKFPTAEELINKISVLNDYYDISDELLYDNEDFEKIIRSKINEVREYSEGLELIKG